jgi:hypothetical protein
MPADFSRYVNLTVHDKDAGQLYRQMIELARLVMPEFNLRRGTLEDAIFQSAAFIGATATNSINRLPDGLMQGIVSLMGYERTQGTRATATASVVLYGTTGEIIPVGTEFRYRYVNSVSGTQTDYLFVVSEDAVIVDAATPTGTINLICSQFGEIPEPTLNATTLTPLSVDTEINTVTFTSFTNGINPLTDQEYIDSAKTYLESISTTYVTAKQLESAVLANFPYVARCKVYDLTNAGVPNASYAPDRGVITFTPDTSKNVVQGNYKGSVSIFVYGHAGALSTSQLSDIQSFCAERTMAGLDIGVYNFQIASFESSGGIQVSATIDASYDTSVTESTIKASIADFLSPQYFPYGELSVASPRLRESTIISRLSGTVPGLLYVNSVQFTPPSPLAYSVVSDGQSGDVKITVSSTSTLELGQRVRLDDVSGTAYESASIAVKSIVSPTRFTIETNYSSTLATSSLYPYFYETSAGTVLNFLNRGVLPSVPTSAITVTLTTESM